MKQTILNSKKNETNIEIVNYIFIQHSLDNNNWEKAQLNYLENRQDLSDIYQTVSLGKSIKCYDFVIEHIAIDFGLSANIEIEKKVIEKHIQLQSNKTLDLELHIFKTKEIVFGYAYAKERLIQEKGSDLVNTWRIELEPQLINIIKKI